MESNQRWTMTVDSPNLGLIRCEHYAANERTAFLLSWMGVYSEEMDIGLVSPLPITITVSYNPGQNRLTASVSGGGQYIVESIGVEIDPFPPDDANPAGIVTPRIGG